MAIKLQLSLAHARLLMKKYAYAMAATVEDHDYPKRAAHKLGVSEDAALALESHVDQYADMKVLNELRRSDRSFGALGGMGFQPGAGADRRQGHARRIDSRPP